MLNSKVREQWRLSEQYMLHLIYLMVFITYFDFCAHPKQSLSTTDSNRELHFLFTLVILTRHKLLLLQLYCRWSINFAVLVSKDESKYHVGSIWIMVFNFHPPWLILFKPGKIFRDCQSTWTCFLFHMVMEIWVTIFQNPYIGYRIVLFESVPIDRTL